MRRAVAAAGWVVLVVACEQPRTELVARVESEVAWGAGRTVQSVTLTVRRGGPTGPLRSARTTALGVGGERRPLPLLVGIVPTDDTDTPVWFEALGCRDPNGCTAATAVVAQRAVVRFAIGQTQEVPLLLASACVGVTCGSDERCGTTGRCEPATRATVRPFAGIDSGTMADAPSVDRPSLVDADGAMDAGAVDAGPALTCPSGMALIPAGTFTMGSTLSPDEQPVHGVQLSAFCMDITEVTVTAFSACVTAGFCTSHLGSLNCNSIVGGRENHPINCVDWMQSRTYCQWRGADLPTEAQWEFAARGMDGRPYPWGSDAPGSQVCWNGGGSSLQGTCAVRSFPMGDSPFGVADMAGNVYEWTLDWYASYTGSASSHVVDPSGPGSGDTRAIRGGAWTFRDAAWVRAAFRGRYTPTSNSDFLGFRCARTPLVVDE